MKTAVYNNKGQKINKDIDLPEDIFNIDPNDHAVYLACKQYLAHQRNATSKVKERAEIKGSTKKIKRQKGTGTARFGDIKNPIFRGGGRVFGPRLRTYNLKLNKKVKRLARKSVLTYKAQDKSIYVLDNFGFDEIKTKQIVELKKNFDLGDKKLLMIVPEPNKSVYLSSRNLQDVDVVSVSNLNTYEMLRASILMFEENALNILKEKLA